MLLLLFLLWRHLNCHFPLIDPPSRQISNLFAFAVVFWFDFDHLHLASPEHRREFSLSGFPFFFSIASYCFEGAGMILSLEESVPEQLRPKFR